MKSRRKVISLETAYRYWRRFPNANLNIHKVLCMDGIVRYKLSRGQIVLASVNLTPQQWQVLCQHIKSE